MPFVKKTGSKASQPSTHARKLFIGRANELQFFVNDILVPEDPAYNIISVSGQGGVGKTTLLSRYIDEAHATDLKDYCLTALVNDQQTTPASVMERFAVQILDVGHPLQKFAEALTLYKKALRSMQAGRKA